MIFDTSSTIPSSNALASSRSISDGFPQYPKGVISLAFSPPSKCLFRTPAFSYTLFQRASPAQKNLSGYAILPFVWCYLSLHTTLKIELPYRA